MNNLRNNISLLYDFYLVAKEMSFSKAATINNISQPSLSRNVQLLEDTLKLTLINRSNKGIELTNDGEQLFIKLNKMFNEFENYNDNYLQKDNSDLVGKITVGTTRNILDNKLPYYLSKFHHIYPNVKISIITDSATNLNCYLVNHKIDVLIDYLPQINSNEKYEVEVKTIEGFSTSFACSKNFYEKYGRYIKSLKDLENYQLLIPGKSRRRQMLDNILQPLDIKYNPIVEMPDSKGMAEFIKDNDCIGYFIKEEVEAYGLVPLNLKEQMPLNHIGIIYQKNTINNITKKFIELVLELSKNLNK